MSDPDPDYDPAACHAFIGFLMLLWITWAELGNVGDREWLLSPDGEFYLELYGLNTQAVWARLVDGWSQGGLYGIVEKAAG